MESGIHSEVRMRGFTLIELMIAVAVVGILAAIAYPGFMAQIRKSRRADGVQALAALQQAQERWRSQNPAYGAFSDLGLNALSANGYYTLSISGKPTETGYVALATGGGSQASDKAGSVNCNVLTVTVGSATTYTPAECWSK